MKTLTALAQLVQMYADCKDITSTSELVAATGYSERAIRKAKAELGCRGAAPECRNQSAGRHPGAGTRVPEAAPECRAEKESFPSNSLSKKKLQTTTLTAQSSARETMLDWKELRCKLNEAGGNALASEAVAPGLANLSTPIMWLEQGADLDRDVLPTIRQLSANRRAKVFTWEFFTKAVAEAKAKREAGLPTVEVGSVATPRLAPWDAEKQRKLDAWRAVGLIGGASV